MTDRLIPFAAAEAQEVVQWAQSPEELAAWCGGRTFPPSPVLLAEWHADPEAHPYLLLHEGIAAGYGEVWHDAAEREAELARIIVDPSLRDRGLGRALVTLLAVGARSAGFDDVWVRVVPTNAAAIACYTASGFSAVSAELEGELNRGQPLAYTWMKLA